MITRYSIATLVVFIISITLVIVPIRIPLRIRKDPQTYINIRINLTTAPILAIAILWAAQCLGPSVIRGGIVGSEGIKPYNIIILFFSLAYMAITLDVTGILEAAAHWVRNKGGTSGRKVFIFFYILLTLVSMVVGNDPVILTGTAFLTYYIKELELDKTAWIISEFSAANTASMVLFVGNPTNVVICEGFGVNNVAYSAYTIFPFLACIVSGFFALFVQFRDDKHIRRKLARKGEKNPSEFLLDPVGALVGGILLSCCLAVILVVSFFGVDVWMISLPFAVSKFIFDLGWDHWRYRSGKIKFHPRDMTLMVESEPKHPSRTEQTLVESRVQTIASDKRLDEHESHNIHRTSTQSALGRKPTSPLSNGRPPTDSSPVMPPLSMTVSPSPMSISFLDRQRLALTAFDRHFKKHFYTLHTALPRLPFALVPFAFSQFILVEALAHQGWIEVFGVWLDRASGLSIYPTIWLVGILGVVLCNISGTNIGATILLTKVCRSANLPDHTLRAAAIALAVASNIGAVSFTFSASLAGLLWKGILEQRGFHIKQRTFAYWNLFPITVMTAVGLAVVCIEMAILYP
jgi:Na+/H+ antiporter NhaD/arsenite permease-like protein